MPPRSTPHLSAATRDLRRDRSIIALAAALCGALAAAGLTALVVVSQLSADAGDRAMSDATEALERATDELERSRDLLQESRRELASVGAWQPQTRHGCGHPSQLPPKTVPAAAPVTTRLQPPPPPVAHPPLTCDEEHRCTVHRDVLVLSLFRAAGPDSRARMDQQVEDGVPVGMTLVAVHRGDPAELFGFRNRDTIVAINGLPWQGSSLGRMIERARELGTEDGDTLTLTIERSGERLTKRFDLIH